MLYQQIKADILQALKQHQTDKLDTLRYLVSQIDRTAKEQKSEPDDQLVISILRGEIKKRDEAIKLYQQGQATDKANKEEAEKEILSQYLPAAMPDDQLDQIISEVIKEQQASSITDMGKVMATLKDKLAGQADMSQVAQKVRQLLS